ncbi:MAG: serine/threonine protein kinase [Clostridia bacterium]|nr:serine/threonine protein kinase [Clostridia bacterium]
MRESEKYKLSTYSVIETLRKTDDSLVELVESTTDSKKYVKKTYNSDKRAVYNMLKEIENPNIPKVYEVFFGEDTVVIEEYIEGETLGALIDGEHNFSKAELEKITKCLLDAVSTLHDKNIIHRDIKPSNIIIKANGDAVLIDYSIARIYSQSRSDDTEHFGTVGYAAPEQYGFSQSDCRTDIYALGVTLKAISNKNNTRASLSRVISGCTEFDPNRRFQSVDEIKICLKQADKTAKTKLISTIILAALIISVALVIILNLKNDNDSPQAGQNEDDTTETQAFVGDELLYEVTEDRIVDVSGSDVEIPCLQLTEEREYTSKINLGEGVSDIIISAKQNGTTFEITLGGGEAFTFTDDSDTSILSYPDGSTMCEIILYDMNGDGIAEIIPVMANAKRAEWSDGSVVLLRNYSLAWCIYYDNGTFKCADEKMTAEMDAFKIYASMPGCINADFPGYYNMKNGEIILN